MLAACVQLFLSPLSHSHRKQTFSVIFLNMKNPLKKNIIRVCMLTLFRSFPRVAYVVFFCQSRKKNEKRSERIYKIMKRTTEACRTHNTVLMVMSHCRRRQQHNFVCSVAVFLCLSWKKFQAYNKFSALCMWECQPVSAKPAFVSAFAASRFLFMLHFKHFYTVACAFFYYILVHFDAKQTDPHIHTDSTQ